MTIELYIDLEWIEHNLMMLIVGAVVLWYLIMIPIVRRLIKPKDYSAKDEYLISRAIWWIFSPLVIPAYLFCEALTWLFKDEAEQ